MEQKRYKIKLSPEDYTIIDPKLVAESFRRINEEMKIVERKFKKDQFASYKRASEIVLNS